MLSREDSEEGLTLIELLVVMLLMSIVSFLAFGALDSTTRTLGNIDDETQGLADLKVVVERLSRDLRAARGVETPTGVTCPNGSPAAECALKIWIDQNSDYSPSADERITWRLQAGAGGGQYDVVRTTDAGDREIVGTKLVSDIAFAYTPSVAGARTVSVRMEYDAFPTRAANQRVTQFEIRLRNTE